MGKVYIMIPESLSTIWVTMNWAILVRTEALKIFTLAGNDFWKVFYK